MLIAPGVQGGCTRLQIRNAQYNLAPFLKKLLFAANREEMKSADQFGEPTVHRLS